VSAEQVINRNKYATTPASGKLEKLGISILPIL
jgi:hypothetical protein